ncbi:MAG: hypothetical protein U0U69_01480 [Acidimicrobiia bacterium]
MSLNPQPHVPTSPEGRRRTTRIAVVGAVLALATVAGVVASVRESATGAGLGAMGLAAPRIFVPRLAQPDVGATEAAAAHGTTPAVAAETTTTMATVATTPDTDTKDVLAFSRDGGIWIADADGSNARSLTRGEGPDDPGQVPSAWMPDGNIVGVVRGSVGYTDRVEKVSRAGAREKFDTGRDPLTAGDDRTAETWLAVSPDGNYFATVTQHTRGCGQCWYKSVVGIYGLTWAAEGEEASEYTFTDSEVGRVEFAPDSASLYVLQGSETGESAELGRISVDAPSSTNPDPLEPPIQLVGIEDPVGFAVGPRGELATISEKTLTVKDPDGRQSAYGAAAEVAIGRDGDTLYVVRSGPNGTSSSVWMMKRSDPAGARKILDDASGVIVRPTFEM